MSNGSGGAGKVEADSNSGNGKPAKGHESHTANDPGLLPRNYASMVEMRLVFKAVTWAAKTLALQASGVYCVIPQIFDFARESLSYDKRSVLYLPTAHAWFS